MPERGILRTASAKGFATPTNAPVYVDSADNILKIIPAGSGSSVISVPQSISASGAKFAAGIAAFVSGAATVVTGLASILSFQAEIIGASFATGATEVTDAVVNAVPSSTGAVVVQGYRLKTTTASASGTGQFYWTAVGM